MKRRSFITMSTLAVAYATLVRSNHVFGQSDGWMTLFDGSNLDQWNRIGDANWRLEDRLVVADKGSGYLVSRNSYTDFQIRAEFWVDADANSGIFIRCSDPQKISALNAYEVNIFDKRTDPTFATGAIVNVASSATVVKAGGQWNTYEIQARGPRFNVTLNGTDTVFAAEHAKFARGPIALQYGGGVVKFRKVEIRSL
jgi:hypothetical protein